MKGRFVETKAQMTDRWRREGREEEVAAFRETIRLECKRRGLKRQEANEHACKEAARNFPPPSPSPAPESTAADSADGGAEDPPDLQPGAKLDGSEASTRFAPRGRTGLNAIPAEWGQLPATASLSVEIGWVQANRLRVVEETLSGGFKVDLSRAVEPAPSRSALAWLETSIRNFAKFTDVLAKVAAAATDEAEDVRRERASIAEIEQLLVQMNERSNLELLADVPAGIRERTRSCLDDWTRMFNIELESAARLHLEAHVAELIRKCVEVIQK